MEVGGILDDIVRYYDRQQRAFELTCFGRWDALDDYRPPSFRSAILHVLQANGQRTKHYGDANDDWFRDIRNAWEREQEHDLAPSSLFRLEEGKLDQEGKVDGKTRWLRTTVRIDRVLMRSAALENGDPEDVQVWAWITKCVIEQDAKERSLADKPGV